MTQKGLSIPFVRAYLRASTDEQDKQRARGSLDEFVKVRGLAICCYYAENESGAKLARPELFRLLEDSRPGDILLIEDVDRLSRLNSNDWDKLKDLIRERQIRIVAVNVPTSWMYLSANPVEFDSRMLGAINEMLLDMLAAIARRDYEQRKERQTQGIAKAKSTGKYKGRKIDHAKHLAITRLLDSGNSWSQIQKTLNCSRSTISRAIKLKQQPINTENIIKNEKAAETIKLTTSVVISFTVENNNKFVRGKKKTYESIEDYIVGYYSGKKCAVGEFEVIFEHEDEQDLQEQIDDIISEIHSSADYKHCFVDDIHIKNKETNQFWDNYRNKWED